MAYGEHNGRVVDDVLAGALFEEWAGEQLPPSQIPQLRSKQKLCSAKRPTRVATSLKDVFHATAMFKQFAQLCYHSAT